MVWLFGESGSGPEGRVMMIWKRSGSVHVCAPYVIEPYTEHYGVVRYRLSGGGLDELSRSVDKLKELAESYQRRQLVDAAEQRKREIELAKLRSSVEHRHAEIREHVEAVLTREEECQPDWSELTTAEAEDRRRREAAELFEQRQAAAKREADDTEARRRALLRSRRSNNYPEVRCPGCKADLNADARSFVEDTDLVRYRCVHCGTVSAWDFDTPVPVPVGAR
jgi:hypothetical protein